MSLHHAVVQGVKTKCYYTELCSELPFEIVPLWIEQMYREILKNFKFQIKTLN